MVPSMRKIDLVQRKEDDIELLLDFQSAMAVLGQKSMFWTALGDLGELVNVLLRDIHSSIPSKLSREKPLE